MARKARRESLLTLGVALSGAIGLVALAHASGAHAANNTSSVAKKKGKTTKRKPALLKPGLEIMPVADIKRGMKGYALTVFAGTQSERFEITVVDVVTDYRTGQDAILFESPDPRLQHSGIVGGMSGSPIYIEGKLVGALAYGYRFNKDPLGGITPIQNMLDVGALPFRPDALPHFSAQPRSREGTAAWADSMLGLEVDPLPERRRPHEVGRMGQISGLTELTAPMSVAGLSNRTSQWLGDQLGLQVVRGGGGGGAMKLEEAAPKKKWKAGDSVSVLLIGGDNSAAPNGTVTWVGGKHGERLLAFGHPMFGDGPSRIPITDSKVHTIIKSVERSVKLSSPLTIQGTMVQDRQAAISLRADIDTPMIPVHTLLTPADPDMPVREYHSSVARHLDLTPNLVAATLIDAVEEGAPDSTELIATFDQTIVIETSKGRRTLKIRDETFFTRGVSASALTRGLGFMAMTAVLDNDFEIAKIISVDQEIKVEYGTEVERIEALRIVSGEVRAGEIVRLELILSPRRGPNRSETIALRMPLESAGEKVVIEFAGGDWVNPYAAIPSDLDTLIDNVLDAYPSRSLVTSIYQSGEGLSTRAGLVADLPDSVLETLSPAGTNHKAIHFKRVARRVLPRKNLVAGDARLEVKVLPPLRR